jgi:hypothetical protein
VIRHNLEARYTGSSGRHATRSCARYWTRWRLSICARRFGQCIGSFNGTRHWKPTATLMAIIWSPSMVPGSSPPARSAVRNAVSRRAKVGRATIINCSVRVAVHPALKTVLPLAAEPITRQDGASKNDCERNAAKRLLRQLRQDYPSLKILGRVHKISTSY